MGKNLKKIVAITTALTMIAAITGCSKGNEKSSMGRYVEERYEAPTNSYVNELSILEDGRIAMLGFSNETNTPISFISDDGGQNWTTQDLELPKQDGKETYTNNIGYLSDGRILVSYYFEEPYVEPTEGETQSEENYVYEEPEYKYSIIETDGSISDIDLDLTSYNTDSDSSGYNNFKCAPNGDVFFSVGSNQELIVQFDGKTFEEKNIYEGNDYIDNFVFVGDSLITTSYDEIVEYDITNGKEKGNLKELEKEAIGEKVNYYPTFINSGSKNTLYYYTTLGVYAYDMKSGKTNMIIDSAISTFGDEESNLIGFIEKGEKNFLAAFNDWSSDGVSVINYTYNPDIPSTPDNQIVIYSLLENYMIRQAISAYSKENPDVYVKYEIGLNYNDGVTQSDALKTLNTEIMGGNGPDVIILDGLTAESYISKGLLEDMSDIINPLIENETIFKNIAQAYTKDGKIYQIPTYFKYPILLGNKEDINSVSDLSSLVELTKKLSTQTDKMIFNNYFSARTLVYSLYNLYGNDWLKHDNTINEDALTDFFIKVNEMYGYIKTNQEAYNKFMEDKYSQLEGFDNGFSVDNSEIDEDYGVGDEEDSEVDYEVYDLQYYLNPSVSADSFLFDQSSSLSMGGMSGINDYINLITLLNNNSDIGYKILTRGEENIFIPSNIVGINAKGKNKEQAKELVTSLLKGYSRDNYSNNGFSINLNKLNDAFSVEKMKEDGYELEYDESKNHYIQGTWGYSDEFGNSKGVTMLLPNDEEVNKLKFEIENLNVGTTVNSVLLIEVAKQFESYVNGDISLEDSINKVVDNLDLYLSE